MSGNFFLGYRLYSAHPAKSRLLRIQTNDGRISTGQGKKINYFLLGRQMKKAFPICVAGILGMGGAGCSVVRMAIWVVLTGRRLEQHEDTCAHV